MKIDNITIKNEGYIYCKSSFYSAQDILSNHSCYTFSSGINKLIGEIDSGNWAISYLISMYKHRPEDFVLFEHPKATINNKEISLIEISDISCYMDKIDPLFSSANSVKELIIQGLSHSKLNYSFDDIKNMFNLDGERFERPLDSVGNEVFNAMAAIGFAHNKEVFCFPWLSNSRFDSYHSRLVSLLQLLESLDKTIIIPIGLSHTKA